MKVLAVFFSLSLSFAFAHSPMSCVELYKIKDERRKERKLKRSDWLKNKSKILREVSMATTVIAAINPTSLPASTVLAALSGLGTAGSIIYKWDAKSTKESKALDLLEQGPDFRRFMSRTLIKARKIKPYIEASDILRVLEMGFETGDFCSNPGKLFTRKKIRKYILANI